MRWPAPSHRTLLAPVERFVIILQPGVQRRVLPVVYEIGQRAILAFEKGPEVEQKFESAFADWNAGRE